MQGEVEGLLGVQFDVFVPEQYTSQVVAGTNVMVKVRVSPAESEDVQHIFVKYWAKLDRTNELKKTNFKKSFGYLAGYDTKTYIVFAKLKIQAIINQNNFS